MNKKTEKKDKKGFWYHFWHVKGTVGEPWMTDEELMQGPHIRDFFENGAAERMLKVIQKNNARMRSNGKGS